MKALFSMASQEGREESNSLAASKKWGGFPSGGQNMTLSHFRERPSGRKRRARTKIEPVPKDRPIQMLWFLGALLQCLRDGLRLDLCSELRLLLCGELVLYLEGNRTVSTL